MWTISGLRTALNAHEDYCVQLIEFGHLSWAFDIAISQRKRELRVLHQCVLDFQNQRECKLEWDDVAQLLAPNNPPFITSLEIQRICNTTVTHVSSLAKAGQLKCVVKGRRGPTGTAKISTESWLNFLKKRAVL